MSGVIFDDNLARQGYGNEIASYPYYVGIENKDEWDEVVVVTSAQNIPYNISLGIYDRQDQVVSTL
jgi:hypothetical protein